MNNTRVAPASSSRSYKATYGIATWYKRSSPVLDCAVKLVAEFAIHALLNTKSGAIVLTLLRLSSNSSFNPNSALSEGVSLAVSIPSFQNDSVYRSSPFTLSSTQLLAVPAVTPGISEQKTKRTTVTTMMGQIGIVAKSLVDGGTSA